MYMCLFPARKYLFITGRIMPMSLRFLNTASELFYFLIARFIMHMLYCPADQVSVFIIAILTMYMLWNITREHTFHRITAICVLMSLTLREVTDKNFLITVFRMLMLFNPACSLFLHSNSRQNQSICCHKNYDRGEH